MDKNADDATEGNQTPDQSVENHVNGTVVENHANGGGGAVVENMTVELTEAQIRSEKRRIIKNVVLISIAFLFNFNAFQGLSRLQSSLNRVEGLGVITSSIIYGVLMVSCMFLPKLVINFIGHRWTIAISFWGYILYMAANGYAVWGTMVTAAILVGLCAAPLWTAQCSYFTIIGTRYSKINNESEGAAVSRFFGIFFMFFQISSITGSIISSTVLKASVANSTDEDTSNCGAHDCPWYNVSANLDSPPSKTVWTMVGIYIGIAICAVLLVAIFVDNLPKELAERKPGLGKEILTNLAATFRHLRHPEQWILIPITMYSGFEQAAFNAEFSRSFVTCSLGIWKVGLVTLPYGFCNAAMSLGGGQLSKYVGRLPLLIFGMCTDFCTQFTMWFWIPNPHQEYVLFILASMWGLTDGIWQTQIHTVYATLFATESEAAFSNYRMWESLGFIIAFAYSNFLCTRIKLYVLTGVLILGMIGVFTVEILHRTKKKNIYEFNSTPATNDGKKVTSDEKF